MPPPIDHQTINFTKVVAQGAIRIDRDYSLGDGITRFSTEYPSQLEGRVKRKERQRSDVQDKLTRPLCLRYPLMNFDTLSKQ